MSSPNFIDFVKIYVRSGDGGEGSVHLHREKNLAKGGPDGGDGGKGGSIILKGNRNYWTLLHLKYRKHIKAKGGGDGARNNRHGADGTDEILEVPLGTVVKEAATGKILTEIKEHEEEKVVFEGGIGGKGNTRFKSSTRQTPRYAQPGKPGTECWIIIELKLLADVGLVGFPNAGKSTLISSLSEAKPKIADYAFTTLVPHLGIVSYRDYRSFVMADIPGIIEGASSGKGLGTRFLRHIERNSALIFMIPADSKELSGEYETLLNELQNYNPELLDKKRILVVSKSDMLDEELKEETKKAFSGITPVFVSAVTGEGTMELKDKIWDTLNT